MPVHTSHIKRQRAIWLRPIVPPLLMYMAGITIGVQAPGYRTSAVIIALVGTGLWLWRWSRSRIGAALPLGLVWLVGYVAIQPWIVPWLPDTHVIHFAGKGRYTPFRSDRSCESTPTFSDVNSSAARANASLFANGNA